MMRALNVFMGHLYGVNKILYWHFISWRAVIVEHLYVLVWQSLYLSSKGSCVMNMEQGQATQGPKDCGQTTNL